MQNFKKDYYEVYRCRGCGGKQFSDWIDLGNQPLANALVENTHSSEKEYPLELCHCKECGLVQLKYIVEPELLFTDYLYYSSTSAVFRKHFEDFAEQSLKEKLVTPGDLVVDIGSNDGILLKPFRKLGAKVIGVEPAVKIAEASRQAGIVTYADYFTEDLATQIVEEEGKAKLITMTNVFAHVDDLNELMSGVRRLLDQQGTFVIEVPYLPNMIEDGTFDLVYHEHLSYFTKATITRTLQYHGFEVSKIEMVNVHGGSMRVFAKINSGERLLAASTPDTDANLTFTPAFKSFQEKIDKLRAETVQLVLSIKQIEQGRIIGFGAPAKASTLLNYYHLFQYQISGIIDDSPAKQGKLIPGMHIPIFAMPDSGIMADYVFIFAWNFKDSIIERLRKQGYQGKFIIPFPRLEII